MDNQNVKIFLSIIILFKIINKGGQCQFFEKSILLTNLKIAIVLKILFFTLTNIKINFLRLKLF